MKHILSFINIHKQKSDQVESIWIEAFDLDKKLDSMLEKKAKSTSKVISSNEENNKKMNLKSELKQKLTRKCDENSNKTIFDYFNPKSKTGHSDLSSDENRKDKMTDYGDEEDSEKNQASIMQAVFRQIFKN